MDSSKIAEILYAEFGHDQFLTREIPARAMHQLGEAMGVTNTGRSLKIKVGQVLSNMEGREYALPFGKKIVMNVERTAGKRQPCGFRLANVVNPEVDDGTTTVKVPDFASAYQVVLVQSSYGYGAICPALRGCVSQGLDEAEALENIKEAITGWLQAEAEDIEKRTREMANEYRAAGFPVQLDTVSIDRISL